MNTQRNLNSSTYSCADFWAWFQANEAAFHASVKANERVVETFLDKLGPELAKLKEGLYFLTGMCDESTAELILTAEGNVRNILVVEDLVACAPKLPNWRFTALKPSGDIEDMSIRMNGHAFEKGNVFFCPVESEESPGSLDILLTHADLTAENRDALVPGLHILLDNYLGELEYLEGVDEVEVVERDALEGGTWQPIDALKEHLARRRQEIAAGHGSPSYEGGEGSWTMFTGELESGEKLICVMDMDVLKWDGKASHPWMSILTVKYRGHNGMPDQDDSQALNDLEEELLPALQPGAGCLYVGRETGRNERRIFFACKDFRTPSRAFDAIESAWSDRFEFEIDLFKDRTWQIHSRFLDDAQ